jgi:geranylgeranyl diphosphate synthase, type I
MSLSLFSELYLDPIETALQHEVDRLRQPGLEELRSMLAYHMGWEGAGAGAEARGKRIRPLLVLLAAEAAGGAWEKALPAAAAVELVHNFSLIHDDIEDQSPLRRGRPTVWTKWGLAQAVNAGDTMFTLAHLAVLGLGQTVSAEIALQAALALQETCLELTQGQFLDLSYEGRTDLGEADYWPMVGGKTAALLSACTCLGSLAASAPPDTCETYAHFGRLLGLAFQAQDDLLGIWGDPSVTGKSAASDLLAGKKSLPVVYGLSRGGAFAVRWGQGPVTGQDVQAVAAQLEVEGGRAYTLEQANRLTGEALQTLEDAHPQGKAGQALRDLAHMLLSRKM